MAAAAAGAGAGVGAGARARAATVSAGAAATALVRNHDALPFEVVCGTDASLKQTEDDLMCPVCLSLSLPLMVSPTCLHSVCRACYVGLYSSRADQSTDNVACPKCRAVAPFETWYDVPLYANPSALKLGVECTRKLCGVQCTFRGSLILYLTHHKCPMLIVGHCQASTTILRLCSGSSTMRPFINTVFISCHQPISAATQHIHQSTAQCPCCDLQVPACLLQRHEAVCTGHICPWCSLTLPGLSADAARAHWRWCQRRDRGFRCPCGGGTNTAHHCLDGETRVSCSGCGVGHRFRTRHDCPGWRVERIHSDACNKLWYATSWRYRGDLPPCDCHARPSVDRFWMNGHLYICPYRIGDGVGIECDMNCAARLAGVLADKKAVEDAARAADAAARARAAAAAVAAASAASAAVAAAIAAAPPLPPVPMVPPAAAVAVAAPAAAASAAPPLRLPPPARANVRGRIWRTMERPRRRSRSRSRSRSSPSGGEPSGSRSRSSSPVALSSATLRRATRYLRNTAAAAPAAAVAAAAADAAVAGRRVRVRPHAEVVDLTTD